jgi:hypothetical protein
MTAGEVAEELHSQTNAAAVAPTLRPAAPVVSVIASVALAGIICVADPESQLRLEGREIVHVITELPVPLITKLNTRDRLFPGATSTCIAKFIAVQARFGDKISTAGVNPTAVERPLAAPASDPLSVSPVMRPENIPPGPFCARTDALMNSASKAATNRLVLVDLVLITFSPFSIAQV